MELDFVRIECDISADVSPQLIAGLHDGLRNFEAQFRAASCKRGGTSCISCIERIGCPYYVVFAQQLSPDPEIIRLHQKPSLPFSLYINWLNSNSLSCTAGMVIVGTAVNYLELFYSALLKMIKAYFSTGLPFSPYTLKWYSLDYLGIRYDITCSAPLSESVITLSGQHILQNTVHSGHIRLLLKSPLRLLHNGVTIHRFDFALFFRVQLRRVSSLCAYYGSGKPDLDYIGLSRDAQNVAVLEDEIIYTQSLSSKRSNGAGLTGRADCSGLIEPMFALLLLGSYFNAGKGAAFGFGFYQLEVF